MKEVLASRNKINILLLVLTFVASIIGVKLQRLIRGNIYLNFNLVQLIYVVVSIVLHELLHAVGHIFISGAPRESIEFGFNIKHMAAYCYCNNFEISKSGYIKSLLLPNVFLTLITLIILFFTDNILWSIIFGLMFSSGAGDYYMVYLLSKYKNNAKFIDHPSLPGFYVIE